MEVRQRVLINGPRYIVDEEERDMERPPSSQPLSTRKKMPRAGGNLPSLYTSARVINVSSLHDRESDATTNQNRKAKLEVPSLLIYI